MATFVLLDMVGGVALLLWGLHMVQSGIIRAFGSDLRRVLSRALGNRLAAFCAGLGLTSLLQSSTATGLMVSSFAAEGAVGLVPALAIMLGANVGTTLIVQILSFNVAAIAPVISAGIELKSGRMGVGTAANPLGTSAMSPTRTTLDQPTISTKIEDSTIKITSANFSIARIRFNNTRTTIEPIPTMVV